MHWGTFNLAMHAWDEPAETLVKLAPPALLMPMLGEAVEPTRGHSLLPWWRGVAALAHPAVPPEDPPVQEGPPSEETIFLPID